MTKKALVTGVGGFVGSSLATALLDAGHHVRGVDNFSTGSRGNVERLPDANFEFTKGDICDPTTARRVVEDVDWVFHQAAIPSVSRSVDNPRRSTRANCVGTATLVNAAREEDLEKFVAASSSSIYGSEGDLPARESDPVNPESPYALSKYYTERLVQQASDIYGFDTVCLRYFNVFGPWQDPDGEYAAVIPKFIKLMLDGERPTIYGDGEQSRDFTFIQNVIHANMVAAKSDASGAVCNVGCGNRVSINELVKRINDYLGTDIPPVYGEPRAGDVRHSLAALEHSRRKIDYSPEVNFEEGLHQTIEHFEERGF